METLMGYLLNNGPIFSNADFKQQNISQTKERLSYTFNCQFLIRELKKNLPFCETQGTQIFFHWMELT